MEKDQKAAEMELSKLRGEAHAPLEVPADIKDFKKFLETMMGYFHKEMDHRVKSKIIQRLISKIEVGNDFVKIHYYVGKNTVSHGELSEEGDSPLFLCDLKSSNTLTNGGR